MNLKSWIEATRLRTLPVSIAGVLMAYGYAIYNHCFNIVPAALCMIFAVLAQIASNYANEYYDFKAGLDRKGREGPRRGVTEGDITPQAMKIATYATLGLACLFGLGLVAYGGWWLILAGIFIALGALAYSTGPYPLSHHALGEVAVVFFYGIIPVNLTYYVQAGGFEFYTFVGSIAAGLMGANILIVNNYRDIDDDRAVGKITLAVKKGRLFMSNLYLYNGFLAVGIMFSFLIAQPLWTLIFPLIYLVVHSVLWVKISRSTGAKLNPFLGMTAMAMLFYCLTFVITCLSNS
jgi:1,4-dihydroxy-2-naphthoate octaprenyltransferase